MPQLDAHYWSDVAYAEAAVTALESLAHDDSPHTLEKRAVLAAELAAIEAHIYRELAEAASLAVGHRVP